MGSVPYIGPRLGDGPIFGISSIVHNLFYTRFEFWVNKLWCALISICFFFLLIGTRDVLKSLLATSLIPHEKYYTMLLHAAHYRPWHMHRQVHMLCIEYSYSWGMRLELVDPDMTFTCCVLGWIAKSPQSTSLPKKANRENCHNSYHWYSMISSALGSNSGSQHLFMAS